MEQWHPLASDPSLKVGGVEIGARMITQAGKSPQLRIAFRRGSTEATVNCVHVAVYAGPLQSLPPEAELARSSEHHPVKLAPAEHFFALNSFVAGIAEVGLGTMFALAREAGNLPVGFNSLMQDQILRALAQVAPAETLNLCLWILDDALQAGGGQREALNCLVPVKKLIAAKPDAPVEVLARLAADADKEVREIARNNELWANCSSEVLARFATNGLPAMREAVADHAKTPPDVLASLAGDAAVGVRRAVAKHKNTLPDVLTRLAGDADLRVRGRVGCNESAPPEALKRLVQACPICEILGDKMFVDWDAGMEFPEEQRKLAIVISFEYEHDLRRCPLCGTYYEVQFQTDNDIFSPTHTGEFKRIPAAQAEEMVREENSRVAQQKQDYKRQVQRLHGAIIKTLSEEEKQVVWFLAERFYHETWDEEIKKRVNLDPATIDRALAHLLETKMVRQSKNPAYKTYSIRVVKV